MKINDVKLGAPESILVIDCPTLNNLEVQITERLTDINIKGNNSTDLIEDTVDIIGQSIEESKGKYNLESDFDILEYIEAGEGAYVTLDRFVKNTKIVADMQLMTVKNNAYLFGSKQDQGSPGSIYVAYDINKALYYESNNALKSIAFSSHNIDPTERHTYTISSLEFTIDGVQIATDLYNNSISSNSNPIMIFGASSMNYFSNAKLYSFKVYDTSTNELLFDLIPVKRKINSKVGLFDKVNKQFYENEGTSRFYASPITLNQNIFITLDSQNLKLLVNKNNETGDHINRNYLWKLPEILEGDEFTIDDRGNMTFTVPENERLGYSKFVAKAKSYDYASEITEVLRYNYLSKANGLQEFVNNNFSEYINNNQYLLEHLPNAVNLYPEVLEYEDMIWKITLKETESALVTSENKYPWDDLRGNKLAWECYKEMVRPYIIDENNNLKRLADNDVTKYYNSDIAVRHEDGDVMTVAPAIYYKVVEIEGQKPELQMSFLPYNGFHVIETDSVSHLCIYGRYLAYNDNQKLHSWSNVIPTVYQNIDTFWGQAQNRSAQFGLIDYPFWQWLMMCCLSEFKTPDVRYGYPYLLGVGGNGSIWVETASRKTGYVDAVINYDNVNKENKDVPSNRLFGRRKITDVTVSASLDACDVIVMGIENPYNRLWQFTQGCYSVGDKHYIYKENRLPFTRERVAGGQEVECRLVNKLNGSSSIKNMILGEYFDILPKEYGGNNQKYWSTYARYDINEPKVLFWGGPSRYGDKSGLGCSCSYSYWSYSLYDAGSRLASYTNKVLIY